MVCSFSQYIVLEVLDDLILFIVVLIPKLYSKLSLRILLYNRNLIEI